MPRPRRHRTAAQEADKKAEAVAAAERQVVKADEQRRKAEAKGWGLLRTLHRTSYEHSDKHQSKSLRQALRKRGLQWSKEGMVQFGWVVQDRSEHGVQVEASRRSKVEEEEEQAAQAPGAAYQEGRLWGRASAAFLDRWTAALRSGRESNWGRPPPDAPDAEAPGVAQHV